VVGTNTAFITEANVLVGSLISAAGRSRVVTSVTSDTSLTVDQKFALTATGEASVFAAVGLDQIVGSRPTIFKSELKSGYTVTCGGETRSVATVWSDSSFTVSRRWDSAMGNGQFEIGGITGSGTASTDAGNSVTVTGSWPPQSSKFLTEVAPGVRITVNGVERIVATVVSNQVLTVTSPFPTAFASQQYTLSSVQGRGTLAYSAGDTAVSGYSKAPTMFTSELQVGDLITVFGQTKLVQQVIDDYRVSVDGFFTTPFDNEKLTIGTISNQMYTVAHHLTGTVYSSATMAIGVGTAFASDLEAGYTIYLYVAASSAYEPRKVVSIVDDTHLVMESALSSDIALGAAVSYYGCSCPSLVAADDETVPGTFSLHLKGPAPATCLGTGRCVPQSAHSTGWTSDFESAGSGSVAGGMSNTIVRGESSQFLSELKLGSTISVYSGTYQEARRVVQINTDTEIIVDKPLSFTLLASVAQPYIVRHRGGDGWLTNDGVSTDVYGDHTHFVRDLEVGYILAIGNENRTVTSVVNNSYFTVNLPWNAGSGGISQSSWAYEACGRTALMSKTFTTDSVPLDLGCCGFKVAGMVHAGEFSYYTISPTHSNQDIRLVLSSADEDVDLYVRHGVPPDQSHYDFRSEGNTSPWVIVVPHSALQCATNTTSCVSIVIGVRGLSTEGMHTAYELSAYVELNFPSFACDESPAAGLSAKCSELGLLQLGDASFVQDATDVNNAPVMRLTSDETAQTGAVWWHQKLHLQNGFETSFRFRISSSCTTSDDIESPCSTGDGFAFVLYGGASPDQIGCGGRALGFASDAANNCTAGVPYSFAVEFDTWHNPDLHDINVRGKGLSSVNASAHSMHNYAHVAFFSQGSEANSVAHTAQLAGTPAIPTITDGSLHQARLVYIPGSTELAPGRMFLYIDDMQSFVLTAPVRLAQQSAFCAENSKTDRCILDRFGNAYIGFTSATGAAGQIHDIRDWNFCDEPNCGR
jgi:hypothetical protein